MLGNPDQVILWQYDIIKINATLAFTWAVMALLVSGSYFGTANMPAMNTANIFSGKK